AHLKARSDAEAAAAEAREDAVRRLKDARKIANVELMRAMDEATRKAVSLKEELQRTEGERREAVAALRAAELERDRPRAEAEPMVGAHSSQEIMAELEQIERLIEGEGARLGGLEDGLRRAVATIAAAEFG